MAVTDLEFAMLAAILEEPDEDVHRLALADHWQERANAAAGELARMRAGIEDGRREYAIRQHLERYAQFRRAGHRAEDWACACHWCQLVRREHELAPIAALAERAEFVRVQCELEPWRRHLRPTLGPGSVCGLADGRTIGGRRLLTLRDREQELLAAANARGWLPWRVDPVGEVGFVFRRGFVEVVAAPLTRLWGPDSVLPALVRAHPIREARATDAVPHQWPEGWGWWDSDREEDYRWGVDGMDEPDNLPASLWKYLRGGTEYTFPRCYPTEADARAALSAALLYRAKNQPVAED